MLFIAGVVASILGSIVGLGGGFVVVPTMRIAFPVGPAVAAGTSLIYVLANVPGATIGYSRQRLIDYRLGWTIAIGAIPASIVAVFTPRFFSPTGFDIAYGTMLVSLGMLTLRRRGAGTRATEDEAPFGRSIPLAIGAGALIGLASSIFGIGGGFVMVPLFLVLARMKPHVVSATSSFVVLLTPLRSSRAVSSAERSARKLQSASPAVGSLRCWQSSFSSRQRCLLSDICSSASRSRRVSMPAPRTPIQTEGNADGALRTRAPTPAHLVDR